MGRRLSDDFPYIGYVHVPPAVTDLDYDTNTQILTLHNSNGLDLTTSIPVPSVYAFPTKGTWDLQGNLVNATTTRTLGCTVSGLNVIPDSVINNIGAMCLASTPDGIPTTGTGIIWSEIIAPAVTLGDNLYSYGFYLSNSSSTPMDLVILSTGGTPINRVWGAYVVINPSGFDSYTIVNGLVTNHVEATFASSVLAGDVIAFGMDYDNNRVVVQKNAETAIPGSIFNYSGMPSSESLFLSMAASFGSSTTVLAAGHTTFQPAATTGGKSPFRVEGAVSAPVGAAEGNEYKVISDGEYNGYSLLTGDYVKFTNGLADLVITRVPEDISFQIPPGVSDITYEPGTGQLVLERLFFDGHVDTISTVIGAGGVTDFTTTPEGLLTIFNSGGAELPVQVPLPDDVTGLSYNQGTSTLTLSTTSRYGAMATTNHSTTIATATGFVGVTDIQPQIVTDNVGSKSYSNGGYILESCVANTTLLRVYVLAITGATSFKPTVTVNGSTVPNLVRSGVTDTWTGYVDITLSGSTITTIHSDGASDTTSVTQEATPVVNTIELSGAYPLSLQGQYEHAAGQTLSVTVTSLTAFVGLELVNTASSAAVTQSTTFAATTSRTVTFTVANRGTTPTSYPVIVRIQNANGTWSAPTSSLDFGATDGTYAIMLNNTLPVRNITSVTYPASQSALKGAESATVNVSDVNVDTVLCTSPTGELAIASPTALGNVAVTRDSGLYNVSINNLTCVVRKTSNATTSTASTVVKIADDPLSISISTPVRLRSGPLLSPQNHTITITSDQLLISAPSLTVDVGKGTFIGSWTTANGGLTWTRSLQVVDSDDKGSASFSGLSARSLSNVEYTTITSGDTYTLGGFTKRTIPILAWGLAQNREGDIGTQVFDTSKLEASNLSEGVSGSFNTTYINSLANTDNRFTITGPSGTLNSTGNLLYNNDLSNATANSTVAYFEIEERIA